MPNGGVTDDEPAPVEPEEVLAALALVTAALDGGGEDRPGQRAMAVAVAQAIESGTPLIVQAGTGTGKSLAYGLPAALSGRKVVIATATKTLQDQLAGKDLPSLQEALGGQLRYAVLKGRSNYLCRQAAAEVSGGSPTLDLDESETVAGGMAEEVARLVAWAEETDTGDRAELAFEPRPAAWSAVSVGPSECPGAKSCPSGDTCFAEAAYDRAREADVVVVNIHLYGAHVASGGFVLPDHDVVVIDEAHEAEDIVASSLGVTIGPGRVRRIAGSVRALTAPRRERAGRARSENPLSRHADALARALAPLAGQRLADGAAASPELAEALTDLGQAVRLEHGKLKALTAAGDLAARKDRVAKALLGLGDDVEAVLAAGPEEVTWVEQGSREASLRVAPIDVGGELARVAWSSATPILTSATIPPGLGARLGLGRRATELDVGSPFDYRRQALLYVPYVPDPRHPGHDAAAHDELAFLIGAAGGRTLALFTSWKAMGAARQALDGQVPFRLLAQGDLPKPALIDAFRTDETSCLFATMGFWQGVDVPGSSCSLVVLDRLPFARPDDPLAQARRERAGPAAFYTVDVPHATVRLAQGVGRLIRSATDRGVVAVLDPRLAESDYRKQILPSLPPMRRARHRSDVEAFFAAETPETPELVPHTGP